MFPNFTRAITRPFRLFFIATLLAALANMPAPPGERRPRAPWMRSLPMLCKPIGSVRAMVRNLHRTSRLRNGFAGLHART